MKKITALLICAFTAFLFEGCAQRSYVTDEEEYEEPAPKPKPKPKPKLKPKPKPAPEPVAVSTPRRIQEPSITTENLYPMPKTLNVDNDLTIVSLTPVSYTSQGPCNEVYFFSNIVTPASGYHGLVDISMSETEIYGIYSCKYFGSAVVYQVKPNPFVKEIVKYEDVVRKIVPEKKQ